jgi:hypothetical protein
MPGPQPYATLTIDESPATGTIWSGTACAETEARPSVAASTVAAEVRTVLSF